MKRAILRTCLALLAVSAGCNAPDKQVAHSKPPEDPTAWSGSAVTRDDDSGGGGGSGGVGKGFLKPTRLRGAMSSEGADIERSLGVN